MASFDGDVFFSERKLLGEEGDELSVCLTFFRRGCDGNFQPIIENAHASRLGCTGDDLDRQKNMIVANDEFEHARNCTTQNAGDSIRHA